MLKITAIGNLTNDVELKMNETTGKPYAILRIASDRRYKDKDGNKLTDFSLNASLTRKPQEYSSLMTAGITRCLVGAFFLYGRLSAAFNMRDISSTVKICGTNVELPFSLLVSGT